MDLVAPVANMLMAAITKGARRHDEQPQHNHTTAPGPPHDDLLAAVDTHSSPGAHRIDCAPICVNRDGPASWLGSVQDIHHRRRFGALSTQCLRPSWFQRIGKPGVSWRSRGNLRTRSLTARAQLRGPPATAG